MNHHIESDAVVAGQKFAYATVSLILGIACFVNLAGMEKAILAIIFARMALRRDPGPVLERRRAWAKTGMTLGAVILVIVPLAIALNFDRIREFVELLERMSAGR